MRRTSQLRLSDVRRVFRLLSDVRDLRLDQAQQEVCIVDGLCGLLDVSLGWAVCFNGFRPNQATQVMRFIPGTVQDPAWMNYLGQWGQVGNFDDDPMMVFTRPSDRPAECMTRSRLFATRDWATYPIYDQVIDPSGIRDTLVLWFRYPGTDRIRGYSFSRQNSARDFTQRQSRLGQLFAAELRRLYADGLLEPPAPYSALPARLQRLLPHLLSGSSQKQIADALALSYQTVRSYTKDLYDHLDVRSREELCAKLR